MEIVTMVRTLTDNDFSQVIAKGVVMVDFWADWCGPCRMLAPTIDELAKENPNVVIGKLNVDDYPELAGKYGVMSIPTLLFFKDGQHVDTSIGVVSKPVLQSKLDALA